MQVHTNTLWLEPCNFAIFSLATKRYTFYILFFNCDYLLTFNLKIKINICSKSNNIYWLSY